MEQGIFLIVSFNFPRPYQPEYGEKILALHKAIKGVEWIEEVFAASGGVGSGPSSIWVFKLKNYGALDILLGNEDEVSKAYLDFLNVMEDVQDMIREEVVFSG